MLRVGEGERKLRSFAFDLGCATRDLLCLFLIPLPVQFAGRFAVVLWCLHVSVIVSQIAVAQRLGGMLFPVKGWGRYGIFGLRAEYAPFFFFAR